MLHKCVENVCDKIHGSTNDVRARSLWLLVLFQLVSNVRARRGLDLDDNLASRAAYPLAVPSDEHVAGAVVGESVELGRRHRND